MIRLTDIAELNIPVLPFDPAWSGEGWPSLGGESASVGCERCAAHRPSPQLDGNLQVDPEIHLPSPGMSVDIAYYYNAASTYNGPFGYGRTMSTNLTAQACLLPNTQTLVTLTRGNGDIVTFLDYFGLGVFTPCSPGLITNLTQDTTHSYWLETTLAGEVTAYPLDTTGQITSVVYVQDAVGNMHTYSYNPSGLLTSLVVSL